MIWSSASFPVARLVLRSDGNLLDLTATCFLLLVLCRTCLIKPVLPAGMEFFYNTRGYQGASFPELMWGVGFTACVVFLRILPRRISGLHSSSS
jgi:hypothetical protein